MSGKPNDKMFATMVKKHGSEEAARAWFKRIGALGGMKGTDGGFAKKTPCNCDVIKGSHTKPQCAGKKGGTNSSRAGTKNRPIWKTFN